LCKFDERRDANKPVCRVPRLGKLVDHQHCKCHG